MRLKANWKVSVSGGVVGGGGVGELLGGFARGGWAWSAAARLSLLADSIRIAIALSSGRRYLGGLLSVAKCSHGMLHRGRASRRWTSTFACQPRSIASVAPELVQAQLKIVGDKGTAHAEV